MTTAAKSKQAELEREYKQTHPDKRRAPKPSPALAAISIIARAMQDGRPRTLEDISNLTAVKAKQAKPALKALTKMGFLRTDSVYPTVFWEAGK